MSEWRGWFMEGMGYGLQENENENEDHQNESGGEEVEEGVFHGVMG